MKNKYVAAVLAFFLGGIGVHKFYLGKPLPGILYLILCWTYIPVILSLIECILFLVSNEDDFNKKYNKNKAYLSYQREEKPYSGPIFKQNAYRPERTCPGCGKTNDPDSNFCESCGRKLQ